jgi:glycosyltransferase involved in cell wall biosynthesis
MEKLVSIILPCFNSALFIHRYLDAILAQTYNEIEIVFVNDGSTDNTELVIHDYLKKFEAKGMKTIYIKQENKGLPGAINTGLKIFSGEYLTWGDPDDFLSPTSIEERVNFLVENRDFNFVRTDANIVLEQNISENVGLITGASKVDIFADLILENRMPCTSGNYLVKSEAFKISHPSLSIYDQARGQNWQLLLPIALGNKCGYIAKPLNNYVIREGSMSHDDVTLEDELARCDEHKDILFNVLEPLNIDQIYFTKLIEDKYYRKKFKLSCNHNDFVRAKLFYRQIKQKKVSDIGYFLAERYVIFRTLRRLLRKLRSFIVNTQ